MTSKTTSVCYIKPTADVGYDRETKRYYSFFEIYIYSTQRNFIVSTQCDDYNVINDSMTNFTIEFLSYIDNNNIEYAYNKELFQEIELAAMDTFSDLKNEEKAI